MPWQLLSGAGGCSSLFPAPPSSCLAESLQPLRGHLGPGNCHLLHSPFIPRIALPGSSFSWLGLVGAAPGIPAGSGSEGEVQPQELLESPWNAPSPVSYTGNHKLETKPAFPIKAAIVQTAALDLLLILHLYLIPVLCVKIGMP